MALIKLSLVQVSRAVPFDHPSTRTLRHIEGDLELDTDTGLVYAMPKKGSRPGTLSKGTVIPSGNVDFMEVLDEDKLAAKKKAEDAAKKAPAEAKPAPKDDTYRPTKPEVR